MTTQQPNEVKLLDCIANKIDEHLREESLDEFKDIAVKISIACDLSSKSKRLVGDLEKTDKGRIRNY